MSEKLYLPASLLLSALILSGTIFLVGGQISGQLAQGLVLAGNVADGQTNDSGTAQVAPTPPAPSPSPTQPTAGPVDMEVLLEGAHVIHGNPETAKVNIVEFSDFECPFCGKAAPTVKALAEKYGDDIAISYKHFPLSFHPSAKPAALACECAAEQGKFIEYHDLLFENQRALDSASLKQYAVDLGLDTTQFNECFDTSKYSQKVDSEFAEGSRNGVSGTPTFFINGQKLVGAQPQGNFEQVIDPLLG